MEPSFVVIPNAFAALVQYLESCIINLDFILKSDILSYPCSLESAA